MTVTAGDKLKIRAADWNDLQAVLRWWRKFGGIGGATTGGDMFRPFTVWIKNTTAATVGAFGVLGIDQPIIDFSSAASEKFNGIRFKGVTPSTSTPHYGKFAVLQEPATANGFARAVIAGQSLVKLNIQDADDVACDIANGQTGYLQTQQHGAGRLLWKSTGTGSSDKWGLIHVGGWENMLLGKVTAADINQDASGLVDIWDGVEGSEADTGVQVTAYNRFNDIVAGSTSWVWVASKRGRLYIIAARC